MFCTGVDDDSKDVILESSNSMHVLYSSRLRSFEWFRKLLNFAVDKKTTRSILACNTHDLTDIVETFQLFSD